MKLINLYDYEALAKERMEKGAWVYYESGSDDEITLRANRAAFEQIWLRPRVLVDVRAIDTRTTILGAPVNMPIMIAPTAYQGLAHPEGECATAQAAARAGTLMIASINASCKLEDIAQSVEEPLWLQLYLYGDREVSRQLVQRAEASGYQALVLTVDRSVYGHRERDLRSGFVLPPSVQAVNFAGSGVAPRSAPSVTTWESVDWLRSITSLPILLKGILTAEDALLAVEHGIAGIIVSNHGGRQLDGVTATLDALPEIVEAVAGRCEILMDGGIRRGTDVLKALALGARAVLIGRPILWGLAVDGGEGVYQVLEILRSELERAMALAGCPTLASISRSLVRK